MSIAFEWRASGISSHRSAFNNMHRMPPFMGMCAADRSSFPPPKRRDDDFDDSSSSSSSIGRNSDSSSEDLSGDDCEDTEVQSSFKGPLDTMDALEEVLPVNKGISKFYTGKSKSFTSLADASSASSIKDFAKPENPYNRKRKNLLAKTSLLDKNRNPATKGNASGISKRPATFSRSTMAINNYKSNDKREDLYSSSSSPSSGLPPLHPHGKLSSPERSCSPPAQRNSCWRSLSLSDLQFAAVVAAHDN